MRILLVNDDGYSAPGIRTLAQIASRRGHDVTILAPDGDRSCSAHSATFFKPLKCKKIIADGYECYSLSGTPVDCVMMGLLEFAKENPYELVISGINTVSNLGTDIIFSGTVQQAIEAGRLGIRAVALSGHFKNDEEYAPAAEWFFDRLDYFYNLAEYAPVNVNFPKDWTVKNELRICPLGIQAYNNYHVLKSDEENCREYSLVGNIVPCQQPYESTDVELYNSGYVTVTPVPVLFNDFSLIERLREVEE